MLTLSPVKFNTFINFVGQNVLWYPSSVCPCRSSHSSAARQDCHQCNGFGYIYSSPPVHSIVALSNMQVSKEWSSAGRFDIGDLPVSIGSDTAAYKIIEYDKIVFTDSVVNYSTIITKADITKLPYSYSKSLEKIFYLDSNQNIVTLDSITFNPTTMIIDFRDYNIPTGTQLSISGSYSPVYYCYTELSKLRFHHRGYSLPKYVILRTFDTAGR